MLMNHSAKFKTLTSLSFYVISKITLPSSELQEKCLTFPCEDYTFTRDADQQPTKIT